MINNNFNNFGILGYGAINNALTNGPISYGAATLTTLPLPDAMPSRNVSYATANSIVVQSAGTYVALVAIEGTFAAPATTTVGLAINGALYAPISDTVVVGSQRTGFTLYGTLPLAVNDVVSVALTSDAANTYSLSTSSLMLFYVNS